MVFYIAFTNFQGEIVLFCIYSKNCAFTVDAPDKFASNRTTPAVELLLFGWVEVDYLGNLLVNRRLRSPKVTSSFLGLTNAISFM